MTQNPPFDENDNLPDEPTNPEVPPEYLSGSTDLFPSEPPVPPAGPDAPTMVLGSYSAELPSTDVPPEYLDNAVPDLPPANAVHPEPVTDVPADYLPGVASYPAPETIPASQATVAQPRPPVQPVQPTPPVQPYGSLATPVKDRAIALVLEILPGLFGFLGLGWIYAGNLTVGLALLFGFWVWLCIGITLSVVTFGIFVVCLIPLNLIAVALSAIMLNNYVTARPNEFK